MTTQEMIAVLSAFEQGKKIEGTCKSFPENGWKIIDEPSWNFKEFDYRIAEEPEYVPYDGTQEGTLVGKIIGNPNGMMRMIVAESKSFSNSGSVIIAGEEWWTSYEDLFKHHKFLDGTPCGMLKK